MISIDSYGCAYNHRKGLQFLTLVFNCSFVSYCSDSPLCIIVTAAYSDIEPPSRSASSTSRLRNAHYLLASCHTFCLNPRQSSRGLCRVQVVIFARKTSSACGASTRHAASTTLLVVKALGLYTPGPVRSTARTVFLHCPFCRGFVRPPRPK